MRENERAETLVDQAYDRLLALLMDQGFAGSELGSTVSLAEKLGMSRTPVRMALARLESEGLIRQLPDRGWARVPVTLEAIEHIFDIMEALNPLLARQAAQNVTPEGAAQLLAIVAEMEQEAPRGDFGRWVEVQQRYHDLLFHLSRNEQLKDILERLNNQWYHVKVGHDAMAGRAAHSAQEHRRVAGAIAAGDAARAEAETLEHIRGMRVSVLNVVKTILVPLLGREL